MPRLYRIPVRTWAASALAALCGLAACSDVTDQEPIAPGRYLYVASHPNPVVGDSIRLRGVMEITAATPEGVEGRWDVPQLHPELETAAVEDGAVLVTAHPTYFGTVLHRITPGRDGALGCAGEYSWIAEGGEERSLPLLCSLSPDVPEGYDPAVPYPETPIIRPLDADTAPPALQPR